MTEHNSPHDASYCPACKPHIKENRRLLRALRSAHDRDDLPEYSRIAEELEMRNADFLFWPFSDEFDEFAAMMNTRHPVESPALLNFRERQAGRDD